MKSNNKTLSDGFLKAIGIARDQARFRFLESGKAFVDHAMSEKGYMSFTGNTITSLAFGVYENGKLYGSFVASSIKKHPLMKKIPKGTAWFLPVPYEGRGRTVVGDVYTDDEFGYEESIRFIKQYRPTNKGYTLLVTTGTEYSEFLEQTRGLNVLTDTFLAGKNGLVSNIMQAPI